MTNSNTANRKQLGIFSLYSASAAWLTLLVVFPIDKINVRSKINHQKNYNPLKIIKNLFLKQGLRGAYRGIWLTPFISMPIFFLSGFIYQNLNLEWKTNLSLNKSIFFNFSPIINIFLTGIFTNFLNTPGYMLTTIIHSQQISVRQALKRVSQKNLQFFFRIYKISYISISLFLSVRQQLYEHLIRIFKIKYKFSQNTSIILTTFTAATLANLIYQPFQVVMARLTVNTCKCNIFTIFQQFKRQNGILKGLYRGFQFRIFSSGLFNIIYLPVYGILKHKFDLHTYV